MECPSRSSSRQQALRESATFNPRSAAVRHQRFDRSNEFFDPRDLLQLKYEALRAIEVEGYSIVRAAREFGLSRPTLHLAQSQFRKRGLAGLMPQKSGPKEPHKFTLRLRRSVDEWLENEPWLNPTQLARRIEECFDVKVHPRTIHDVLQEKGGIKR